MLTPAQSEFDRFLRLIAKQASVLAALTPSNVAEERAQLIEAATRNKVCKPHWVYKKIEMASALPLWIKRCEKLVDDVFLPKWHRTRLEELRLELALMQAVDTRGIRKIGKTLYVGRQALTKVKSHATRTLKATPVDAGQKSAMLESGQVQELMRAFAHAAGLTPMIEERTDLMADAAVGENTIFIKAQPLSMLNALRLCFHEIGAHLISGANGRSQPLAIFGIGTAGSFTDQEGLALYLEEHSGSMDSARLRVVLARALAVCWLDEGASFNDVVRTLVDTHHFDIVCAVQIAERTFRAGGTYRDIAYLLGWQRVGEAIGAKQCAINDLWHGKVGLDDIEAMKLLRAQRLLRAPIYKLNAQRLEAVFSFARNLVATTGGTSRDTSPPNMAASLTMFELT